MKSERPPVAIVGGGFSGTMVAANLARRGIVSILIEATDRVGLGTAYSTREPAHVLNVRAESMSAWADDPAHFARYYQSQGGDPRGFAERRLFGRYMRQILEEAVTSGCVEVVRDSAIGARPDGTAWQVELARGTTFQASAVVLATGNQPPQTLRQGEAGSRFVENPWGEEAKRAVARAAENNADVLLIGTGLTMVDLVLSLDAAGHLGRIVALSRRGLAPRGHADFAPAPVDVEEVPLGSVRNLWRWLRRRSATTGWQAAVDALRPHSHRIWQRLGREEQQRFLRHARPWWDVHRHRIAPKVAARLKGLIADGRLAIVAGRILGMNGDAGGVQARIRRRGCQDETRLEVGYAFNCTGPLGSIARTRDPLLKSLLDKGLAQPDPLGIGLEVDGRSRVAGSDRLWALGPLTKARYWEIIAVPDIREQAAQVAEDIAMELGR